MRIKTILPLVLILFSLIFSTIYIIKHLHDDSSMNESYVSPMDVWKLIIDENCTLDIKQYYIGDTIKIKGNVDRIDVIT